LPSRGSTVADAGGCGCRVGGRRGGAGALFAAALALLAGWRRRRGA
jgi:MYXO-CTERM domain-containing protein